MNIEVYRTDKHGEISLTIGQKIIINKNIEKTVRK